MNFTLDYLDIDWKEKLNRYHDDADSAFQFFYWKMNALLNKHMPWKKLTNKEYKRKFKPWITNDTLVKISQKHKIFNKYKNCKDPSSKKTLKQEFNALKDEIAATIKQNKKMLLSKIFH